MDDLRVTQAAVCLGRRGSSRCRSSVLSAASWCRLLLAMNVALLAASQTGCSAFVMAGKMLFGDPKLPSAFKAQTGVDLAKENKKILVVCSTPDSIKSEFPSIDFDLIDSVTRRLRLNGIDVVDPDRVASWMDDNGGAWRHPSELAGQFDADYIAHIDLEKLNLREENSPSLWRGHVDGAVFVYKVENVDGQPNANLVFEREYASEYPKHYPVSVDQKSLEIFTREYVDQVSTELARYFHDYRMSEQF